MTWLKKSEPTEAWEIEDEGKIGDIELARQIREICNSVADSAEAVSVLYYGPSTETKKREIDRYERAKKRAEKNIEQISDELLRDTAIYQVLNFCMKAGDVENAERLFHQIQTARIAELVKSEHPMFRDHELDLEAAAQGQPVLAFRRTCLLGLKACSLSEPMKFVTNRPFADAEGAARRLMEQAQAFEPDLARSISRRPMARSGC